MWNPGPRKYVKEEQPHAGVKALQAGLLRRVCVSCGDGSCLQACGRVGQRADGRDQPALLAARVALLYSVVWHTGLRVQMPHGCSISALRSSDASV